MSDKVVKFTVNLPRELHRQAKIQAAKEETTLADVIRKCLEEFVRTSHEEGTIEQTKKDEK